MNWNELQARRHCVNDKKAMIVPMLDIFLIVQNNKNLILDYKFIKMYTKTESQLRVTTQEGTGASETGGILRKGTNT